MLQDLPKTVEYKTDISIDKIFTSDIVYCDS